MLPAHALSCTELCHAATACSIELTMESLAELCCCQVLNVNITESHLSAVVSTLSAWQVRNQL